MNPEQLHAHLIENPQPFITLNAEARALMREQLRTNGPFSEQQRAWLGDFYLLVLPDQLAAMRAVLPSGLDVSPRETIDGQLVLGAHLLTDCIEPTDTWHSIASTLAQLTIVFAPEFPPQEVIDFG